MKSWTHALQIIKYISESQHNDEPISYGKAFWDAIQAHLTLRTKPLLSRVVFTFKFSNHPGLYSHRTSRASHSHTKLWQLKSPSAEQPLQNKLTCSLEPFVKCHRRICVFFWTLKILESLWKLFFQSCVCEPRQYWFLFPPNLGVIRNEFRHKILNEAGT